MLIATVLAFFGPFLLPPHVVGIYITLGSFLFEGRVWRGEPDRFFYDAFFIEFAIYFCAVYGVIRFYTWLCSGRGLNTGNASPTRRAQITSLQPTSTTIADEGQTDIEKTNEKLAALVKTPNDERD